MNRNLARLTNAANRIEAWKDWDRIVSIALERGMSEERLHEYYPGDLAGWRRIDRAIHMIRESIGLPQKIRIEGCRTCEASSFKVLFSDYKDAGRCIECEHCGTILYGEYITLQDEINR
jgi:hypothetical protein